MSGSKKPPKGPDRVETIHHHQVGELTLSFEELPLNSAPPIVLSAYIAELASPTAELHRNTFRIGIQLADQTREDGKHVR